MLTYVALRCDPAAHMLAGIQLSSWYKGGRRWGVAADGKTTLHALGSLEARGSLFTGVGTEVYTGMIIGECARENNLEVNPVREKKLSNVRASGADEKVRFWIMQMLLFHSHVSCNDDSAPPFFASVSDLFAEPGSMYGLQGICNRASKASVLTASFMMSCCW